MAFALISTRGALLVRGATVGGDATVTVELAALGMHMPPAEARKLSAELLQAAADAEAMATEIIKGNADIAQTAQVAV